VGKGNKEISQVIPKKVLDVLDRCNTENPDPKDIKKLKQYLNTYPDLWKQNGDTWFYSSYVLLNSIPDQTGIRESFKKAMEVTRDEMGYQQANQFERLLIEHLVLCWFQLQFASLKLDSATTSDAINFHCKRLSAAQRRYLRAAETLARIRRMSLPSVTFKVNAGCPN
jgi:hypothetical protein